MRLQALHFQLDDHVVTYLFWSETPTGGLETDRNFQPWAQKKRLYRFELSKLVSGDSEAIRVQCKNTF